MMPAAPAAPQPRAPAVRGLAPGAGARQVLPAERSAVEGALVPAGHPEVAAQLKPVATNFKISSAAVTIALILTPLANGSARILWGCVSDHLGREWTMFTAFLLQSIFLVAATTLGRTSDFLFVTLMVLVFLTWGEIYVLFPAVLADLYGSKSSALNYSFLYSAKGFASLLGAGIAASLFEKTGTWDYAFFGGAGLAFCAALLALVIRKMPLPHKRSVEQTLAAPVAEAS